MTDRIQNLTVVLMDDFRDDDAEHIVNAIRMIKGVRSVEMGPPVTVDDYFARQRVYYDIRQTLLDALDKEKP